jgi:phosphatidylserine/phosphatidylglycerophosphate/cardiolipin synthase-like enzyme
MKNFLTSLFLILLFGLFTAFVTIHSRAKTVISVFSPTKFEIENKNTKSAVKTETICVEGIETFTLDLNDDFYNKHKDLNISNSEMIALGFLAQDYAQKTLLQRKISLKYSNKTTAECHYAQIKLNGLDYEKMLENSGFGIINGKITNQTKFKEQLEKAKKLNLVILNHHSNKFHTLDCPYGKAAHDFVIMPFKQIPKNAKPCKFCHNKQDKKSHFKHKKQHRDFEIPNIIQPPLALTTGDIKVLVTDFTKNLVPSKACNSTVCKELIKIVDNSNESLDIAIYGYDEIPALTAALKRAKNRGVSIRFVYDKSYDETKDFYKDNQIIIQIANVSTSDKTSSKTLSNLLMHNKFVISDNSTVFTGSMNFSPTGTSGYDVNDIIIIKSKEIANLYKTEFEQMLNGKFHTKKAKSNLNNHFKLGESEIEVYFSPQDKPSGRIIQLIDASKTYIYMPTFLITHNEISQALIRARHRGVDVRVIIDANSTSTRNSKHAILRNEGILLKTENFAGKLHSKTIIIDDEYLISGSMNFSNSGENKNDENLLIIKNSKIAKLHKEFFLYLWTIIPKKYLKYNAKPESKDSIGSCSDGVDNNFNGKIDKEEELCK